MRSHQRFSNSLPRASRPGLLAASLIAFAFLAAPVALQAQPQAKPVSQPVAARQVKRYTIEQFMDTVRVSGSSFSPDEKSVLFSSNKTGIFNAYTVPTAGGAPKQLTNSTKESTFAVSYLPTDSRVIYTYDRGGNENSHLYVLEADGTERDLTPGEKTKASFLGWSHDRKSFFFSTNERDAKFFDVYELNHYALKVHRFPAMTESHAAS